MIDVKSMLYEELQESFSARGERPYRAEQVFSWLHSGVRSFGEMTNLPLGVREELSKAYSITFPEIIENKVSKRDGTVKYLWQLDDGAAIESVLMEYESWNTVCISTQAGCRMGCAFCASAIGGLQRNLAASEMLDQVILTQLNTDKKVSNVVLMGIGEPLDNFDNVTRFLRIITHSAGVNIGARHITLSTCGLIENIDKLAQYSIQFTLTVSLHAPDDETRTSLMPINRTTGVDSLLAACFRYFNATGRRVSIEYAMISGINDTEFHAKLLAEKLKNSGCHLNIIRLSDVPQREFRASSPARVKAFTDILRTKGIGYTIRRSLGGDIDASCGQLRRRRLS